MDLSYVFHIANIFKSLELSSTIATVWTDIMPQILSLNFQYILTIHVDFLY